MRADLTGNKYGSLVVIGRVILCNKNYPHWLCKCDCGSLTMVRTGNLTSGNTKSCGCMVAKSATKHGYYAKPTYNTWIDMKNRCLNPNDPNYDKYGGAGIGVCDRWLRFENFVADMGERPDGCTIDRIDNSKGYCLDNCRWATPAEQARNRKTNRMITAFGETMCFVDAAKKYGLSLGCLSARLKKFPPELALTMPIKKTKNRTQ